MKDRRAVELSAHKGQPSLAERASGRPDMLLPDLSDIAVILFSGRAQNRAIHIQKQRIVGIVTAAGMIAVARISMCTRQASSASAPISTSALCAQPALRASLSLRQLLYIAS